MDDVGRLRIVCVTDRRRAGAALAVRGRLERVARSELGPALDRQVATEASVRLERLTVRLDLDPSDYDDHTLAVLWAGQIRSAILAAGAFAPPSAALAGAAADAAGWQDAGGDWPATGVRESPIRLARRAMRGDPAAATETARAILADPAAVIRILRLELSPAERRALLRALEDGAADIAWRRRRGTTRSQGAAGRRTGRSAGSVRPRPMTRSWGAAIAAASRQWLAGRSDGASAGHGAPASATPAVMPPGPMHGAREPAPDPRLASHVAGLALLWPWLTVWLGAAADRLRRLDPVQARRLALAALVSDLPGTVDDPVARLLAGDDLATDPSLVVVTKGELLLAADGADALLHDFAASLPGFAGSTPDFVRREFLVRAAMVDAASDPVAIRAAPLPLDPALSRLHYPIGLFRLPWSRPIAMHLEQR